MHREITINAVMHKLFIQHASIYISSLAPAIALCGHVNIPRDIEVRLYSTGLLSELKLYEEYGWVICKKCIELSN